MYIYGLFDPVTKELRYIGKTNNIKNRLRCHLGDKENNLRTAWIKSLKSKNLKPSIFILEEVSDNEWTFWEQWYIEYFRYIGCRLTNMTAGGEKDGMTGRKHSEESKRKMSISHKGKNHDWVHIILKKAKEKCLYLIKEWNLGIKANTE